MENNHQDASPESDARRLVHAFYKAFGNKDIPALNAIVSEDWLDVPMSPGQLPGRPGLTDLVNGFHENFSDVSVAVEQVVVEDDTVVAKVVISGKQIGRFLGVEPTSEPAWFAAHDFHRVRDGRIVRTDHLEDLFGFLERAGAFPE